MTSAFFYLQKVEPAVNMYNSKEHYFKKHMSVTTSEKKEPKVHHLPITIQCSI